MRVHALVIGMLVLKLAENIDLGIATNIKNLLYKSLIKF
jgi:hypothetical protein